MAGCRQGFEHGLYKVFGGPVGEGGGTSEDVARGDEAVHCYEWRWFLGPEKKLRVGDYGRGFGAVCLLGC